MKKKAVKTKEPKSTDPFHVLLVSIIFDPKERKILIARKDFDPELKGLKWFFPGTELKHGQDMDQTLKKRIKEKTGFEVKNLGAIFSKVYPERKDYLAIYFLCEVFKGSLKPWKFYKEIKWVRPGELEKHFAPLSFHPRLREYIMNLR
ncbi:NUDIX domain-containing protein [Candidatus Pacearchaeota archaeon]|nr:NUDIX domain-containing protein [Candidatus Pacearchaeota archaeon]